MEVSQQPPDPKKPN